MMHVNDTDHQRITALISLYRSQIIRFLMDRYRVSEYEAELLERQLHDEQVVEQIDYEYEVSA